MMLSARELCWRIRATRIVSDIDLDIVPGETLGLVGPNGSGKSTLLRLLAGMLVPSHGTIELDGKPLKSYSRREIAQKVAFVEQMADTSERMTARDAVELGRTPWLSTLQSWSGADDLVVERSLSQVGMQQLSDREWQTLSGGERQRLHIARALAQQPSLLLLDEPTNHLDIEHQLGILRLMKQLAVTSIIAMHDLNQAMGCDRICVLQGGARAAIGPPRDVLTPELIREVFRVDVRFIEDPHDRQITMRFSPLATDNQRFISMPA